MQNVIIFGITDLSEVLIYHLERDTRYRIAAITADKEYIREHSRGGVLGQYPIIPFELIEEKYSQNEYAFFICVGYSKMNEGRKSIYRRIIEKGYQVLTYVHPMALVQTEQIGDGCLFFENVTIGSYCSVGSCNIFYPCSHIAHHTRIGDFNFFAISCSIAGYVEIANQCFFGNNSTTRDKIKISDKTLIGANAYLDHNSKEGSVIVPNRSVLLENKISDDIQI